MGEGKEGEVPAAPITRIRISGGLEWKRGEAAQQGKSFFQSRELLSFEGRETHLPSTRALDQGDKGLGACGMS